MLLKMKELQFIATTTEPDGAEQRRALPGLTAEQKEQLRAIDELNVMTCGEHFISNYEEL